MDSRLQDMLTLVSRVHEKRGDIRFMLRQDRAVQHEVHSYLDSLSWLSQLPPLQPNRLHVAAGKEQLIAMLNGQAKRRRRVSPLRVLGAAASLTLIFGLIASTQAATHNLPEPVDQVIGRLLYDRDNHVKASTSIGLEMSTPAESVLEAASTGFTN